VYTNAESGERSVGAHNPWDQDVDVTVYEAGTAQATFTVPANTVVRHIY
jgi:hypothetical protein